MKKKRIFLSVLLVLCTLFAFFGCSGTSGSNSVPNASEIAANVLPEIETNTSHEWQLYEEAKEIDGYAGTFMEFLVEIGFTTADDTASVNDALTSAVCVESFFGTAGAAGAGVIYSLDKTKGDAYIITNYHVVYGKNDLGKYGLASEINLYLYGGYVPSRAISATFLGGEMNEDIAVLSVKNSKLLKETESNPIYAKAAKIGDSASLQRGERVYAIGNPDGEGFSVVSGAVSVPYETIDIFRADDVVQIKLAEIRIDAAINPGNSGGGLFNAEGELVGIVNARRDGTALIGFALPMANVQAVLGRIGV